MPDSSDQIVKLIIEGENLLTDEVNKSIKDLESLSNETKEAKKALELLQQNQRQLQAFKELSKAVKGSRNELLNASIAAKKAKVDLKAAGDEAGVRLTKSYEKAQQKVKELRTEFNRQNRELTKSGDSLKKAGVNTDNLGLATINLNRNIKSQVAALDSQRRAQTNQSQSTKKSVVNIEKEIEARRKSLSLLDVEKKARKLAEDAIDKQLAAIKIISAELDEEGLSHKKVEAILFKEEKARERVVQSIKSHEAALLGEKAAIDKQELAISSYEKKFHQLATAKAEGRISTEKLIKAEAKLRASLDLTEAQVRSSAKGIKAIVKEQTELRQSAKRTTAALKAEGKEAIRVAANIKIYEKELEDLNRAKNSGTITTGNYIRKEKALRSQLKLTSAQIKTTRAAIQADGLARSKAVRRTDLLTTATRRLAQAYTVLIAAQTAVGGLKKVITDYGNLESAISGVDKTTVESRESIEAMANELKAVSEEISGSSIVNLLRFAEVAGQMGIEGTLQLKEMALAADALSVATELAGDVAVRSIARIQEITGETEESIFGISSAVVALGNSFKLNEEELLHFADNIAAATTNARLSSDEILGISAAMKQIALPAERSRAAVGRVFTAIAEGALAGGEAMTQLIEITGLTGKEIREQFGKESSKTFVAFIEGLKRMQDEGQIVTKVLNDMGIAERRTINTLQVLTGQVGELKRGLELAAKATREQTALTDEAVQRWVDQESAVKRVANQLENFSSKIGEALSDETMRSLEAFSNLLDDTDNSALNATESIVRFGGEILQTLGAVVELAGSLGSFGENSSIWQKSVSLLEGALSGFTAKMLRVSRAIVDAQISIAEFSDSSAESIDRLNRKSQELQDATSKAAARTAASFRVAAGTTSVAFESLKQTYDENIEVVETLSETRQLELAQMVDVQNHSVALGGEYRKQTAALTRLIREAQVKAGLDKILAEAAAERARLAKIETNNLNLITEAEKNGLSVSQELLEWQKKRTEEQDRISKQYKESIEFSKQLATEEGQLAFAVEEATAALSRKKFELKDAITAGIDLEDVQTALAKAYIALEKAIEAQNKAQARSSGLAAAQKAEIDSLVAKHAELTAAKNEGTIGTRKFNDEQDNLISAFLALLPNLDKATKKYLEQQLQVIGLTDAVNGLNKANELNSITTNNVNSKVNQYISSLDSLTKEFQRGEISLGEYTKRSGQLASVLSSIRQQFEDGSRGARLIDEALSEAGSSANAFGKAMGTASIGVDKVAVSTARAAVATRELASAQREAANSGFGVDASNRNAASSATAVAVALKGMLIEFRAYSDTAKTASATTEELRAELDKLAQTFNAGTTLGGGVVFERMVRQAKFLSVEVINNELRFRALSEEILSATEFSEGLVTKLSLAGRQLGDLDRARFDGLSSHLRGLKNDAEAAANSFKDIVNQINDQTNAILGNDAALAKSRFNDRVAELEGLRLQAEASGQHLDSETANRIKLAKAELKRAHEEELAEIISQQNKIRIAKKSAEDSDRDAVTRSDQTPNRNVSSILPVAPVSQPQQGAVSSSVHTIYLVYPDGERATVNMASENDAKALISALERTKLYTGN